VLLVDALGEEKFTLEGALAWKVEAFVLLDLALLIFSIYK
jgi:hypothetical protein